MSERSEHSEPSRAVQRSQGDVGPSPVGTEVEVDVGAVAHGGHCVARHQGRVLFVRHTLPGERVRARVTEGAAGDSFWRADAVEILRASPDRVDPPCPWARPGRCGGCDFQHADLAAQRRLKAVVVAEQLSRLAGLDVAVDVEPLPGDEPGQPAGGEQGGQSGPRPGLRYRTRVAYAVSPSGQAGLHAHRSSRIVPVDDCRIAAPAVAAVAVTTLPWPRVVSVDVATAADERLVVVEGAGAGRAATVPPLPVQASVAMRESEGLRRLRGRTWLAHDVDLPGGRRTFRVTGAGFWQVHPGAPLTFVQAVLAAAQPQPGERAVDAYSGVGLFAAALAQAVGETGSVVAIESDARAASDARRNLRDLAQVTLADGRVQARLAEVERADVVVLDPPRAGARRVVVDAVAALAPRVVVYVACDPASLARDVALFAAHGYRLDGLRAFDAFPQTHHVECVARLVPAMA